MLSSELHPDHDSFALIKDALHGPGSAEDKLQHLREVLGENVIISGWINDPSADSSNPEAMIAALKERVEKFETNQHLREIEGEALQDQSTEEAPPTKGS
ncbi:MAG TPA: hypothetical protein V6C81_03565 [Planktothrix sp.]|jgi:hypothetical protein